MKGIDYVICAAGDGRRFSEKGIEKPKPQIILKGKSFLERSLEALKLQSQDRVIVVTRKDHRSEDPSILVSKICPGCECVWLELETKSQGQLHTFYLAKDHCAGDRPVVVWNCDTYFKARGLQEMIQDSANEAIVPCGKMAGEQWSFFKTDSALNVFEVAEKRKISEWASVGYYFFRNQKEVFSLAEEVLNKEPPSGVKEHYVSLLYPYLIHKKRKILVCPVDEFKPFGTPQEVESYWNVSLEELKKENQ